MTYTLRQNPAHPNNYRQGRTQTLDKIVIHHAATTDFDGIGRTFQNPVRYASAHYGVGRHNNVDQYVSEADTAFHAGTPDPATNPNPSSIGIENVNMTGAPDWLIDEATFSTLVELVSDIAHRNNLLPLVVGKNLFQHKNFAPTYCAGKLGDRLQELADRVNGSIPVPPVPAPDQVLRVGEKFVFPGVYRVDEIGYFEGIAQVRSHALCPVGFTWADNGIPAEPLTEVDGIGNATADQVLYVGSTYKIPGTFTVLDTGIYLGRHIVKFQMGKWIMYVDAEPLEEV